MRRLLQHLVLTLSLCLFLPRSSQAEGGPTGPGTNNPTGVTGDYNGSITTAGSYDPFTGNAKREVRDLTVAGSVGAYPLEFKRILNTRSGWGHNYGWAVRISQNPGLPGGWSGCFEPPPDATISYPDGAKRNLHLREDGTYEQLDGWEPMADRLVDRGGDNYDLHLKDGGIVEFRTGPHGHPATAIVDPYINDKKAGDGPMGHWGLFHDMEERRVFLGPEAEAARSMSGESPRSSAGGTLYHVDSVTGH